MKNYIKERRIAAGMSQRGLGKAARINWHTIQKWEYGQVIPRDVYSLHRVATVLNCRIEDLVDLDGNEPDVQRKDEPKMKMNNNDSVGKLIDILESNDYEYVDKTKKEGGCVWVIGGADSKGFINELKKRGYAFKFTMKGGKASKGKPTWYWKPVAMA